MNHLTILTINQVVFYSIIYSFSELLSKESNIPAEMEDKKILFISQTEKSKSLNCDFFFFFFGWILGTMPVHITCQWLCPESSQGNCFSLVL